MMVPGGQRGLICPNWTALPAEGEGCRREILWNCHLSVRDPCASDRKIGVMSGDRRIARTTISLELFKVVLLRIFVRGPR
jgi:hypothetical protein